MAEFGSDLNFLCFFGSFEIFNPKELGNINIDQFSDPFTFEGERRKVIPSANMSITSYSSPSVFNLIPG